MLINVRKQEFALEAYFDREIITHLMNFNFAPKSPKMEDFLPKLLYLWKKIFGQANVNCPLPRYLLVTTPHKMRNSK